MAEVLRAEGITVMFGGLVAVDAVSLDVPAGGIVSLIGPNGAGKTTLFNALTGLHPLSTGRISLGERNITGLGPHRIAQFGVARTFQNIRLFGLMTAEENVKVAMHESAEFTGIVRRIRDEKEVSVLIIEHDMSVVMRVSERITVLNRGRIIAEGGPEDIRSDRDVVEAYLGTAARR